MHWTRICRFSYQRLFGELGMTQCTVLDKGARSQGFSSRTRWFA